MSSRFVENMVVYLTYVQVNCTVNEHILFSFYMETTSSGITHRGLHVWQHKIFRLCFSVDHCIEPLGPFDQLKHDTSVYGLNDQLEANNPREMHIDVGNMIGCSGTVYGWEFIPGTKFKVFLRPLQRPRSC